ncbi:hypothetical protein HDV00_008672 [Rhizophlyctis rosea]|nr:hypothetical protein HDV00_008672 [Rhizophlyctis rosea]
MADIRLLVQASKAFYHGLGKDHHTRSMYLRQRLGTELTLYRAIVSPTFRPLLTAGVTNNLLRSGAVLPRHLVQKAYQLSGLSEDSPGRRLKAEVWAIIHERGQSQYGQNMDLSVGTDDFERFAEQLAIFALQPDDGIESGNILTELVETYNFILDPLQIPKKHKIYTHLSIALYFRKDSPLQWLERMSSSRLEQAVHEKIYPVTMVFALQHVRRAPQEQKDFLEWFTSHGLTIDPRTISLYARHTILDDDFINHIPFLLTHTSQSVLVHGLVMRFKDLVNNRCAISRQTYLALRTELPTFDPHLAAALRNTSPPRVISYHNVRHALQFGSCTAMSTHILHIMLTTSITTSQRTKKHFLLE